MGSFLMDMKGYAIQLLDNAAVKAVGAFGLVSFSLLFPENEQVKVAGIFGLVIIDFLLGVSASYKEGKAITSHRTFKGAVKVFVYVLLLIAGSILDLVIGTNQLVWNFGHMFMAYIALTEALSVIENSHRLGFPVPQGVVNLVKGKLDELNKKFDKKEKKLDIREGKIDMREDKVIERVKRFDKRETQFLKGKKITKKK